MSVLLRPLISSTRTPFCEKKYIEGISGCAEEETVREPSKPDFFFPSVKFKTNRGMTCYPLFISCNCESNLKSDSMFQGRNQLSVVASYLYFAILMASETIGYTFLKLFSIIAGRLDGPRI